jgi:hypothetical protein
VLSLAAGDTYIFLYREKNRECQGVEEKQRERGYKKGNLPFYKPSTLGKGAGEENVERKEDIVIGILE